MDSNNETSADMAFEYTGVGCSVPKDITSVRCSDGLQKIGDDAFYGCSLLAIITLPSTVTETGINAFCRCSNLREVTLNDGLQKIGNCTFYKCTSLESIKIPSTVIEISAGAFRRCYNLREITFNEGLQKIGDRAFFECSSLECITLPPTTTEIGTNAFYGCSNLREVICNDGLQKIGACTFHNCTSLGNVTLPSTLVEIGSDAFYNCRNLREVILNGVPRNFERVAFDNCDALERFVFPTISYRLKNIIQTSHWEELEDKLNEVRGAVQWDSDDLFVSRATHHNWNDIRRDFGRITRLVSFHELKEATSTFELALWKSKLDQADALDTTNRTAYRIDVPGPVKDTILQYLNHI